MCGSDAGVAELAYAADLKSAPRKGLRVQIPPPAPPDEHRASVASIARRVFRACAPERFGARRRERRNRRSSQRRNDAIDAIDPSTTLRVVSGLRRAQPSLSNHAPRNRRYRRKRRAYQAGQPGGRLPLWLTTGGQEELMVPISREIPPAPNWGEY